MQGVNLGNWLVAEKWMDERLFADFSVRDEFGLSQIPLGAERLAQHRKDWLSEADFKWMSQQGIKLVRLPIGFWTIDSPDIAYIDWAMKMAQTYDLKVLVSFHGAPGSQNGKDHSGQIGEVRWFKHRNLQDKTIEYLVKIAERYNASPAFWGIGILNEPQISWKNYWILRSFYRRAYRSLKRVLRPGLYTIFSDAFVPILFTGMLYGSKKFPVAMDIHWYSFGMLYPGKTPEQHFKKVARRQWIIKFAQLFHPVIVGEWSAILPRTFAKETRIKLTSDYYNLQKKTYSIALAECYWSYKTADSGAWNYRSMQEPKR